MRIVSLLPSATEIVYALGLGDELVGVTHECDYPPEAADKPVVTRSVHDLASASSRDIHRLVSAAVHGGSSLYALDEAALAEAAPGPDPHPGALPGLRRQLPRGQRGRAGHRCGHHRRLARADLDRRHPQHDHHGRGHDRVRGHRHRPGRVAARAAGIDRAAGPGAARRRAAVATGGRARMARPSVRGRSLGSRTDPSRRGLGPARRGRRAVAPDRTGMRSARWIPRCSS